MGQRNEVKYTPAAVDDMDEIFSYIVQDNLAAAEGLLSKLSSQISRLGEFPHLGSVLAEDDYAHIQRGYRFIVVQPYLVFYRILGARIVIHRILHGRRDYLRELFGFF